MNYRDLLSSRLRRDGGTWHRFKAAPRAQIRAMLLLWRPRFAPTLERPEELSSLRRDVPLCLDNVARSAAGIVAQRPVVARAVGTDGDGVRDLVARRGDCNAIAASAGQIEYAAGLAERDAAAALSEDNDRALRGLAAAYEDPATPAAERKNIIGHLSVLNGMAEMALHLRGQRSQRKAHTQAEGERAIQQKTREQEIAAAVAQLLGGR